jgi:hypothetical protein
MQIVQCKSLEDAERGPFIEIREGGGNSFMLSVSLVEGESLLTGSFPSAATAESFGVKEAERRGIEILNVVHTSR